MLGLPVSWFQIKYYENTCKSFFKAKNPLVVYGLKVTRNLV